MIPAPVEVVKNIRNAAGLDESKEPSRCLLYRKEINHYAAENNPQ